MKTKTLRRRQRKDLVTNSRWIAYASAGAATAMAGAGSAEADIHYSGMLNQIFNAPPGGNAIASFQLAPGANAFSLGHFRNSSGGGIALFADHGSVTAAFNGFSAGFLYVSKLAFGANIATHPFVGTGGGTGTLAYLGGFANSQWLQPGTGFIGFRFNAGAGVEYGWAQVTMDGAPGNSFTLVDYAWGDVGTPVTAGQVPEPGSLGLLALGATGLIAWRKVRAKANKA